MPLLLMTVTIAMQVVTVVVTKHKKHTRHLPKLALMASLVTLQAQAALVSPDQEEWLWRDLPVIQNNQNNGQAAQNPSPAHESSGGGMGNVLLGYGLGYLAGHSSGSNNSANHRDTTPTRPSSSQNPAKPNPDTSHWYSAKPNQGSSRDNSGSSSGTSKGYSSGGFGASASKGGSSSGSSGG